MTSSAVDEHEMEHWLAPLSRIPRQKLIRSTFVAYGTIASTSVFCSYVCHWERSFASIGVKVGALQTGSTALSAG